MDPLTSQIDVVAYGVSLLLKASAVLAVAWIFSLFLRRRSAGLRHLLWSTAFAAVVALPLVSAWMPPLEVDVSRFDVFSRHLLVEPEQAQEHAVELSIAATGASEAYVDRSAATSDAGALLGSASASPSRAAGYILAVWLAGVAGLAAVFLLHVLRSRRITKNAVSKARIRDLCADVAVRLELDRSPRVLVGQVEMPVTWGLFHPVVLLPVEAAEWGDRRLRIVLMHELAHVRRFDYLPHILAELSCIVYWPNPLVWIARFRLRAEQEQACDDLVLRTGTASHDYAALLLDIARTVQGRRLLPGALRMAERRGLKTRIRSILDPDVDRGTASLLTCVLVLAVVAVPALPMAALRSAEPVHDEPDSVVEGVSSSDHVDARAGDAHVDGASGEDGSPAPDDASGDVSDRSGERTEPAVFTLTVEAEGGRLVEPMAVRKDEDASGGRYVVVPDQDGHDPPDGGPGQVTFDLDVQTPGVRAVWARVIGDKHNDNSFFVSVDGNDEFRWDILDAGGSLVKRWAWVPVVDPSGRPLEIEPGVHTLTFHNREDGSRLDAVFVTSDPGLIPRGRSLLPPPETSVSVSIEAEDPAEIVAPMEIRVDNRASGRLYVSVAERNNSRGKAPEDGHARYVFDVPAGRYVVWARVKAPNNDSDSFWVRANDDEWILWNGIARRGDWTWQLVHDSDRKDETAVLDLHDGANTLEFAYREDGAKLDRIVVTNNVYQHPDSFDARASGVTVSFND